jgi:soluble lytic murein transglycosylase
MIVKIYGGVCFFMVNCMLTLILSSDSLYADIYMYTDTRGVTHFTNRMTSSTSQSSNWKIFISEEKPENKKRNSGSAVTCNPSSDAFDSIILRASEKHDVAFPLIKAVIKAESDFNPQAISKVGAKGLMQLMDENLKHYHIEKPFDPYENIMGGTRYLKKMLKRFEGKLDLALAAYNAGPGTVERYKRIPPYKETQVYVQKVMLFHNNFAELYEKAIKQQE